MFADSVVRIKLDREKIPLLTCVENLGEVWQLLDGLLDVLLQGKGEQPQVSPPPSIGVHVGVGVCIGVIVIVVIVVIVVDNVEDTHRSPESREVAMNFLFNSLMK
jgi:hypothetical protein